MVYVPVIITVWVVVPAYMTLMANLSTNIVDGVCVSWGAYSSVAAEKTVPFLIFFIAYLLPLTLMIYYYSRTVHALRTKVNKKSSLVIVIMYFSNNYHI